MLCHILGPLEIYVDGRWTGVGAPKPRALFAALVVQQGRVASTESLVDELWGNDPPPGARKLISGYVLRLRRLIGDPAGRVLATQAPGYRLMMARADLDAYRFEDLLAAARSALAEEDAAQAGDLAAQALALWRGPALADVQRGPLTAAEAGRLEELRLAGAELRIEAEIRRGHGAELIPEVRQLTMRHPLRERFWHQLMRLLEGQGRPAEALAVYAHAREAIADELGADPGPELQQLHQRILVGDRAAAIKPPTGGAALATHVVPRQLPAVVRHFTGRAEELTRLSRILDEDSRGAGTMVISAIGGTAGVGKTALAVRWAHQVMERFPDGQLYVNLRGYDPGRPVPAAEALAGFLRALGVPGQDIQADTDQRAAQYRSLLAGRRMLVLLDNAGDAEQVRPLLPGSPASMALVTSRDSLAGLVAREGARRLDLGPLPLGDAIGLLRELIGGRADADSAAVATLADQCSRLPLALRVAAELAVARPTASLTQLANDLAELQRRLDLLDADGDPRAAVRAVFSWSYRNLDTAAARAFRLLSLHPGADLDSHAAAALIGTSVERVSHVLGQLARAYMIQSAGPGRISMHDLLRVYASERAAAEETPAERRAAIARILDWYMYTAHAAAQMVSPARRHVVLDNTELDCTPLAFSSYDGALDWLDAERPNLVAAVTLAAEQGVHEIAWKLPVTLWDLFNLRNYWADWIATHRIGLASTRILGSYDAEIWVKNNLAAAYIRTSRNLEAADLLLQSLTAARELSDRHGQAVILANLGVVRGNLNQPEASMESYRQALEIHREIGDKRGEGVALSGLGDSWKALGQCDRSVQSYQLALAAHRTAGDGFGEAAVLLDLSQAYLVFGKTDEAIKQARQAVELNRKIGHRHAEAMALGVLGRALAANGHRGEARTSLLDAYKILESIHDSSAAEMLGQLSQLDQ